MAMEFKEVAMLRGNDKKFDENFNQIDWNNSGFKVDQKLCKKNEERTITIRLSELDEFIEKYPNGLISTKILRSYFFKEKGLDNV